MADSGCLTEGEMGLIFVNWKELIMSNTKLLKWVLTFLSCKVRIHFFVNFTFCVFFFLFILLFLPSGRFWFYSKYFCPCRFVAVYVCIQNSWRHSEHLRKKELLQERGRNKQQEPMHIYCSLLETEPCSKQQAWEAFSPALCKATFCSLKIIFGETKWLTVCCSGMLLEHSSCPGSLKGVSQSCRPCQASFRPRWASCSLNFWGSHPFAAACCKNFDLGLAAVLDGDFFSLQSFASA